MFVDPSQVADVVRRHADIRRARLVVDNAGGQDRMVLHVEVAETGHAFAQAIVDTLRDVTKMRGEVEFREPGSLPNDGKVIEDVRKYE
jgi:phenylacetate-CoA ligase